MKPLIGVTSSIKEDRLLITGLDYVMSMEWAGGTPVVLPNLADAAAMDHIANSIDGLLVTGGKDIDPTWFGEEPHVKLGEVSPQRDHFEMQMVQRMMKLDKPILGICRGCQILNVTSGGDLYQDIHSQNEGPLLQHYQVAPRYHVSHFIDVVEGSLLHQISGSQRYKVNSYHHQALRKVADGFEVTARASDGIIEAFESKNHKFVLGVQWHPENLLKKDDVYAQRLFQAFIEACRQSQDSASQNTQVSGL
ncbi:gamma-glutamyl-gamma-aminobutyrate hydrolase family protein [Paenibacillus senegalensis]|uniref:gamma-glutamyl-gamma-aminobutyrate hydrolase family protein n=1 Tax=Paenibacillus senegalensis TaxID=1465766 RepID=UPI000287E065|nr:gamma-glutamyl-gamma-aminobutyrate hydrolase family protein [Paenibacillus senegalensis]